MKLVTELPSVDHSLQFLVTQNLLKTVIIRIYEHLTEDTISYNWELNWTCLHGRKYRKSRVDQQLKARG